HDLAADLWGDMDGVTDTQHAYGKGMVVWGLPLKNVLEKLNVPKDFDVSHALGADLVALDRRNAENPSNPLPTDLVSIHRRTTNADIYFVANQTDSTQDVKA